MTELTSKEIALAAANAGADKKAEDVEVLELGNLTAEADYFVICSAPSITQVRAIVNEVLESLGELGVTLIRSEGRNNNGWVLLDYGSVVVHVFLREDRQYYSLEKLWAGARSIRID